VPYYLLYGFNLIAMMIYRYEPPLSEEMQLLFIDFWNKKVWHFAN